jgi:hypothetical protein
MKRSIRWLQFRARLSIFIPGYWANMRGGLYDGDVVLPHIFLFEKWRMRRYRRKVFAKYGVDAETILAALYGPHIWLTSKVIVRPTDLVTIAGSFTLGGRLTIKGAGNINVPLPNEEAVQ